MTISYQERLTQVQRFYELLGELEAKIGGTRTLLDSHGRMQWPQLGVYFFYEPGEMRSTSGNGHRIVRVGTHALKRGSKTTLWNRLSQHQGTQKSGGGNHRGSVFRLHVGTALIARDQWSGNVVNTWSVGSSASRNIRLQEQPLECAVSQHIRNMPFLFLEIDDEPGPKSLRGYIERYSIALLSNYNNNEPIDLAGEKWLGRYARSAQIRESGLWNVNHVDELYDPQFLEIFEKLVMASQGFVDLSYQK